MNFKSPEGKFGLLNWYLILIIAPKIRSMTISEKLQQIDKQNKYSGVRFGRVLIVGREILRIIDAASQAQGRARGAGLARLGL